MPRVIGFIPLGIILVSIFHESRNIFLWAAIFLQVIIWPHAAYFYAKKWPNPRKAEYQNLYFETFLCGVWMNLVSFQLWPSTVFFIGQAINLLATRGFILYRNAVLFLVAAARMFGVDREKIMGQVCHRLICPAEEGACPITDKKQRIDNSERILLNKDGHAISILKTVVSITLKGRECLLVLMDVQMPEMDGIEATRVIRDPQSNVRNHDIRIVALTGHAMDGDRKRYLEVGMNDYLSKPINSKALYDVLIRNLPRGIQ